MTGDDGERDGALLLKQVGVVMRDWRAALVRALTEPLAEEEEAVSAMPTSAIEHVAARAAAAAGPYAEVYLRPILQPLTGDCRCGERGAEHVRLAPSPLPARAGAWLSAEEVAPLVGIPHTLFDDSPKRGRVRSWYVASEAADGSLARTSSDSPKPNSTMARCRGRRGRNSLMERQRSPPSPLCCSRSGLSTCGGR